MTKPLPTNPRKKVARKGVTNHEKVARKGAIAGVIIVALVALVLLSPGNAPPAAACEDPFKFTDQKLAQVFARTSMDGRSWATAYTFAGNGTSGWTFWETTRYVVLRECRFNGTEWGVRLWATHHVRVLNCTFANNTCGILVHQARDLLVTESTFVTNKKAIDLWRVSNSTVTRNIFRDNTVGLLASSCCTTTSVRHNQFDAEHAAAEVASPAMEVRRNFYADYFAAHPEATLNASDPEADYCPTSLGAAFPLSEPVSLGSLGILDDRPLRYAQNVVPSVGILTPPAGSCWNAPPLLEVTFAGTLLANASYEIAGSTIPLELPSTCLKTGAITFRLDEAAFAALPEGSTTVVVRATSYFNETGNASKTLVKDTIAPAITLVSPANGSLHSSAPSVTLCATDANFCSATYELAGAIYAAFLPTFTLDLAAWSAITDGAVSVPVHVTDAARNGASLVIAFAKDASGPSITARWVSGTPLCGVMPPSLIASASDPAGIADPVQYVVGNISWTAPAGVPTSIPSEYASLPDGVFAVVISVRDSLGNPSQVTLAGSKDTIFDSLAVLAPIAATVVSADTVPYFAIEADDEHGVASLWVSLDGGLTRHAILAVGFLPAEAWTIVGLPGSNVTLLFGATDAAGNNATVSIIIHVAVKTSEPGEEECRNWWCSPPFWVGMSVGMFAIAVLVAVPASARRQKGKPMRDGSASVLTTHEYRRYAKHGHAKQA